MSGVTPDELAMLFAGDAALRSVEAEDFEGGHHHYQKPFGK